MADQKSEVNQKPKSKAQLRRDAQRAKKAEKTQKAQVGGKPPMAPPKGDEEDSLTAVILEAAQAFKNEKKAKFKSKSYYDTYWEGIDNALHERERSQEKVKNDAFVKIEKKLAEFDALPKTQIELKIPEPTAFRYCFICNKAVALDNNLKPYHFHRTCVRGRLRQILEEYSGYGGDRFSGLYRTPENEYKKGLYLHGLREVFYFYTPVYDAMCSVFKGFIEEDRKFTDDEYVQLYDKVDELYFKGYPMYFEMGYYACNWQLCNQKGIAEPRVKRKLESTYWLMTKDKELEKEFDELVGEPASHLLYFDRRSYVDKRRHRHFEIVFTGGLFSKES